jgi:hypothetical protein
MNVPYHLLLEHPLFEKLGSTIGIQNAAPEQLYHGGVRILKTQDPQQLKTAVEIFGKKYGIETIHCEIKGNKKVVMINNRSQRMHIEYANDTFTVCVYDPSPQLNSVQQTTIRSLDQAQQIEPHEHTVLVYIDYFAPGVLKEGPFPYSIQIKTRKPEKIRVNTRPIVRRFETIEQICTHITTTLPNEVINMLSDSCSITFGFSTYDMKKQFDPTSTESIYDAYTTALSRAIVSGIQAQSFTTKTIQGTSHQDAGDVCFEKYYC